MRFAVIRTGESRHQFIWTHHHLLTDGWSSAQVIGEVLHHYHRQTLAPLRGRYRDSIEWLQSRDPSVSEAFWRERLAGLQEPTLLVNASQR